MNTSTPQSTGLRLMRRLAYALLSAFVFTIPLAQMVEVPALNTISQAVGLLAMAAGVIAVAAQREVRAMSALHVAMGGFIVWSAITFCWSVTPELANPRLMTYVQLFVLVILAWELCTEEKHVLRLVSAFVLGTVLPAVSTVLAFLPGQQTLYQRAAVQGFDPNVLAFLLALSLPASYYLGLREKNVLGWACRLQLGVAVSAILLTCSYTALASIVVCLAMVFWTLANLPVRSRLTALAVLMTSLER